MTDSDYERLIALDPTPRLRRRPRRRALQAQEASESSTATEPRRKKPDPNTFQSDHPTLTYFGQYLTFTNTPPPPPPGPMITAALGLPPDIRFLHYEHITDALDKLEAHADEVEEEQERLAEEAAEEEEWKDEQAQMAEERMEEAARKRRIRLIKKRRERAGTYRPSKDLTVDDAVERCWELIDKTLIKFGKDYYMQFPYEPRSNYTERMKVAQDIIGKPLKLYRKEIQEQIEEWRYDGDIYGEEEAREVAEGYRPRLSQRAREWKEERMVYHWSGLPIWKNEARAPRVLARKAVDRGVGKCYQCAAAEDDVICTRREGLKEDCGRCRRLGLHCLVPSTQYTYDSHCWHYGEFGEGNKDPLPRYAVIARNELYNQLPPEEDVEARDRLRDFLNRVREEERRLVREKRERERRVEWVGGEKGFVVRDRGGRDEWALPRAEFKDGRYVGFDAKKALISKGSKKLVGVRGGGKKKKVVKGRGEQKKVTGGEGLGKRGEEKENVQNESTRDSMVGYTKEDMKQEEDEVEEDEWEDAVEQLDDILEDHEDPDDFDDAQNVLGQSLEDEIKTAAQVL